MMFFYGKSVSSSTYLFSVSIVFMFAFAKSYPSEENSDYIMAGLASNWVTQTYYLQKASWILIISLLLISFIYLISVKEQYLVILVFFFLISQIDNPKPIWDKESREVVSYEGIADIDKRGLEARIMYFNFDNWLSDAYLISLSGLQFESYTGHEVGPKRFTTTTFMPSDSFSGRNFYTDERNALCVGQSFIGSGGEIITRDKSLESKLRDWCGKGPFPSVKVYNNLPQR